MKNPNTTVLMRALRRVHSRGCYDREEFLGVSVRDFVEFDMDTLCGMVKNLQKVGICGDLTGRMILAINMKIEAQKKGHKKPRIELLTDDDPRRPWNPVTVDYVFNQMWMTDSERRFDYMCAFLSKKDKRGRRTDHTDRAGMYPVHRKLWGAITRYNGELYTPFANGFYRIDRRGEDITYTENRFLRQALLPSMDAQVLRDEPPTVEYVAVVLQRSEDEIFDWWHDNEYGGKCPPREPPTNRKRVVYCVGD